MSDRASPDLPFPEGSGETLWVVDVTAPLAPGRVRWVAAEAAARLQLPAEKLVALLENRIGPVTKPLPKASADRVAEVLDLAGAEVAIRAAGPADASRAPAEDRSPGEPDASDAGTEGAPHRTVAPDPVPSARAVPEPTSDADAGPVSESASKREYDDAAERVSERAAEPAPEVASEAASEAPTDGRTDPVADAEADAATTIDTDTEADIDAEAQVEVVPDEAHVRSEIGAREDAARTDSDQQTAVSDVAAAEDEDAGTPDRDPLDAVPPPVGRPGSTKRHADAHDDPWRSLGDDEDEAMLGAWTHRAASAPVEPPTTASSTGSARVDAARVTAPRATPRSAPPAAAPGGRRTGSVVPAFDPSDPPQVVVGRHPGGDDDEDDEDEEWAYGLRDPFAEAERQERAMRRWALAVALLVALGIFLVLQWAYSRPGLDERTPPAYGVGLTAYREGAFVSAARAWAPRAEAGDVDAMFMLGWMAEYGQGRPWSNREAAGWYGQAAQRGHAPSQLRLADLYAQGLGVAFDPDVATRWYLEAAEAGLPRAQREAALAMARDGRHAEAAAWLDRAAAHDPDAAAWLALMDAAPTLKPRSE